MQRTFEDLGTPLAEVTFCVVDIETTGGSAADGGITEIAAVKVRTGETLGTFATFVNPGTTIPRQITVLTGITQAMVAPAPSPEQVLPAFTEFVGSSVIVGHNVRYDLGYLNAVLERSGRPRLANRAVDTLALARRLLREEVPNCRLGTTAAPARWDHLWGSTGAGVVDVQPTAVVSVDPIWWCVCHSGRSPCSKSVRC